MSLRTDPRGVPNLAPFSQFTNVSYDPPHVLFCPRADTDTARNVAETGEFVVNMATYDLRHAVNATSAVVPPEIDEAALADLEMAPSRLVKPRRVAASPSPPSATRASRRGRCSGRSRTATSTASTSAPTGTAAASSSRRRRRRARRGS